ncbi:MAG: hypothetical protein ACO3DS_11165, partial [Phycisphaerales bacterium]
MLPATTLGASTAPETIADEPMHEAASCLTTTGHTVIRIAEDDWPVSRGDSGGALHQLGALAVGVC